MFRFIFLFILSVSTYSNAVNSIEDDTLDAENVQNFEAFLGDIRTLAIKKGISTATLDAVFTGLTPDPKVIEYDRNQAEFTLNFWHYLTSRVSDTRLEKGKIKLRENQLLLDKAHQKYGVLPSILVAFWGLETNYGKNVGKMNLVRSLATLSFDFRRRDFFTSELLALLKLIDDGKLPYDAEGSWAGAMGNTQFMPSNVAAYGIDADQNGKLDLWGSKADIFHSSANFLKRIGWHKGEKWGREVTIPADFNFALASLKIKKSVKQWQDLGVRNTQGGDLPNSSLEASLILPMGFEGPAFLVYRNFHAILRWNRSILYAISVGHLSDKLLNNQTLIAKPVTEPSLNRADVTFIQTKLNSLGFNTGKPDGISGPKTRNATREFQQSNNLPVDGYVGYKLLQKLSEY
ncbi:Membrane-bound lytic murein transglycosylase B precursor [uncultured Candidatus Thioglobus sp.]|nr:Membrane-bound lytic murein transglycosylase B precursor [uncultured Candidatus Thioglobus sp.]